MNAERKEELAVIVGKLCESRDDLEMIFENMDEKEYDSDGGMELEEARDLVQKAITQVHRLSEGRKKLGRK